MSPRLPPSASVAETAGGDRLFAPAAARNLAPLCDLLADHAPRSGRALEIASGTGEHVIGFAKRLPGLTWQPSDIDTARRASINAYAAEAALPNIAPALPLDATQPGWAAEHGPFDLIMLANLLHLIPTEAVRCLTIEAAAALAPGGKLILYGPFKREGELTSPGDIRFDAELRAADPSIGYKDDLDMARWLSDAGLSPIDQIDMPANNLAFIAGKPSP
ncbi:DUF938 domain-containing protein [Sulfitobacter sp. PS-8MA]|uniref:DUF938 domain-containing protein n=1 Tax=Sulfitobacter sp. PS-8MA TaxID=3237707 RepID=UPI0034C6A078